MANLLFMGTASDPLSVAKQMHASGGIALEHQGILFLVNPGPGSLIRAKQFGCPLRDVSGIILTDLTLEAANDVNVVIDAMTYSGHDKRGILICPREAVESDDPLVLKRSKNLLERIIIMEPKKRVGIDDVEVYGLRTNRVASIGYKFVTSEFVLSYLSDPVFSVDLFDDLMGSDIIILGLKHEANATEINDDRLTFHQVAKIISEVKPRLAIITDFSASVINADPLLQARLLQKETGIQVISAKDGQALNPKTYARMRDPKEIFYKTWS